MLSSGIRRASLKEESVAGVAHSHRFGRCGQWKFVVRATVAEDLSAVPTVMLNAQQRWWCRHPKCVKLRQWSLSAHLASWDGELFLAQLAVARVLVFQPHLPALQRAATRKLTTNSTATKLHNGVYFTWRALLASLMSSIFILDLYDKMLRTLYQRETDRIFQRIIDSKYYSLVTALFVCVE